MEKTRGGEKSSEKVGQQQLYDLLLSRELSWQEIIYDLISSEQLDPWDIDLVILASSYLKRIQELKEANFFLSSKILLAASILLRIKSELLLSKYIRSIDEILFGKSPIIQKKLERIELDEMPEIIPKTPLPRLRKVSLQELMAALDMAITTEQRRLRREEVFQKLTKHTISLLPKIRINIRDRIFEVFNKIKDFFRTHPEQKLTFSYLAGEDREQKIATFVPLLHLDNQSKILLEQEKHFEEIFISMK